SSLDLKFPGTFVGCSWVPTTFGTCSRSVSLIDRSQYHRLSVPSGVRYWPLAQAAVPPSAAMPSKPAKACRRVIVIVLLLAAGVRAPRTLGPRHEAGKAFARTGLTFARNRSVSNDVTSNSTAVSTSVRSRRGVVSHQARSLAGPSFGPDRRVVPVVWA